MLGLMCHPKIECKNNDAVDGNLSLGLISAASPDINLSTDLFSQYIWIKSPEMLFKMRDTIHSIGITTRSAALLISVAVASSVCLSALPIKMYLADWEPQHSVSAFCRWCGFVGFINSWFAFCTGYDLLLIINRFLHIYLWVRWKLNWNLFIC